LLADLRREREEVVPTKGGTKRKPKRKKAADNSIVRNSYSLPKRELEKLTELVNKLRYNKKIQPQMKKSEIVRVGLVLAGRADVEELLRIRNQIGVISVGRPTKT
jgi:hypothetical protein